MLTAMRRLGLLVVGSLLGCGGVAGAMRATPPDAPYRAELQADRVAELLIVDVDVDGTPARFVFDTGAGSTVVSSDLYERAKLRRRGSVKARDSTGAVVRRPITRIGELGVGGVQFSGVGALVADLEFIGHFLCTPVDGILGTNVMFPGIAQIDYASGRIELVSSGDEAKLSPAPGESIGIPLVPGPVPAVPLAVDGGVYAFVIDTGSNGSLGVEPSLFSALGVADSVGSKGSSSAGLSGDSDATDLAFPWPAVALGELQLEGVDASTSALSTIGNQVLGAYTMRIDFDRGFARLWPNGDELPRRHETFGIAWDYDEQGTGASVVFVRERSAASRAGLSVGDAIEKIGDQELATLSQDERCRLRRDWSAGKSEVRLTVGGNPVVLERSSLFGESEPETEPESSGLAG